MLHRKRYGQEKNEIVSSNICHIFEKNNLISYNGSFFFFKAAVLSEHILEINYVMYSTAGLL